jgi:adenine-specific DNA-methyltransferase
MTKIAGKQEILSDLEKRVADKILEPSNFDLLKKLVENADTLDEAIKIAELGTTYKRTGFHFDKRLEKQSNTISYLKKNNELSFETDANAITHKLIIGDNYPALLNLLVEYKGKIDVIYIDPPYGKDRMGEFAETNYDNAITRDNLLSMLYPRLYLAKQLLSETGVIFCSIDDRNQAYVKCLFDEVFEERNFVTNLKWKKKKQPSFLDKHIASIMEYVLVYAKNENYLGKLSIDKINGDSKPLFNASNKEQERTFSKGIKCKYKEGIIPKGLYKNRTVDIGFLDDVIIKDFRTQDVFKMKAKFRDGQENIDKYIAADVVYITQNNSLRRDVLPEELEKRKSILDLIDDWGQNQDAFNELLEIFEEKDIFRNPKPTLLIKNLIKSCQNESAIILDFFAGSGTTGQAVLELNKEDEDGGQRQFILVTNNEKTDTTPNGIAVDVTSKRLKRVMTGKCYNGTSDFEWAKKNKPLGDNLLVLDIAEVANFEAVEGKTPFAVIDETLYGKEKFATVKEKVEWVCNNFEITQKRLKRLEE